MIALLIIAGTAYILITYTASAPAPGPVATSTAATTTEMTVIHVQEDTETYSIDASYPQFGIASVDAEIKKTVESALAEFRTYSPNPPESATPKNSYYGKYENVYQGGDVVSVSMISSEDTGGAHPNTSIITINVDPRTGAILTLDNALSLIGKNLPQVATESQTQVKAELGADALFVEGFAAKPENYSMFRVTNNSVIFVFNVYQVAPYAAGPQEAVFARVK